MEVKQVDIINIFLLKRKPRLTSDSTALKLSLSAYKPLFPLPFRMLPLAFLSSSCSSLNLTVTYVKSGSDC